MNKSYGWSWCGYGMVVMTIGNFWVGGTMMEVGIPLGTGVFCFAVHSIIKAINALAPKP